MTPYKGNEPYIFISYAHKDSARVLPIIEALSDRGFRIWYDAGIEVGTEWPEYIATYLKSCTVMLAFVSPAFDTSHNCRREINYALNKNINVIAVYLESFEMSGGMELQLGTLHSIYYERHRTPNTFYDELAHSAFLLPCRANLPSTPNEHQKVPLVMANEDFFIQNGVLLEYRGKKCEVIIPEGVTAIGHAAFIRSQVERVVIRDGVTSIGQAAFQSCSQLTSVTIPGSVKTVGEAAFLGCEKLTEVTLRDGLATIGNNMFALCTALKRITIPDSVKTIESMAFLYCTSLESVTMASGLENIGCDSFAECSSLETIAIPETVHEIGKRAFVNCKKLEKAYVSKHTKYARFFNKTFPSTTWVIKN